MPHTLSYRPVLMDGLISNERLSSYQHVFRPADDVELMGAYLWNAHVCSVLYPLISLVEIALRNAVDRALTRHLGTFWWSGSQLRYRSHAPEAPMPHPVRTVQDNFVKATRLHVADLRSRHRRQGRVKPTHVGILAKTEFSTWECLLDSEFMGRNLIWPKNLSSVFQGPWPSSQASTVLTHARDLVATIRAFRNRLFHHEPAWKRYGVQAEQEALEHLRDKIDKVEILLNLIHPESVRLLKVNGLLNDAYRACTSDEIRRFQHLTQAQSIDSLDVLSDSVNRCLTDNRVITATLDPVPEMRFLIVPR